MNNSRVLVSIVIPMFNNEKYIAESIQSILGQSYSNIELIVVNDGSTDSSAVIVNGMSARDRRIQLINSLNRGVASARNVGVRAAKGKYLAFVDADDWVAKNFVEDALKAATDASADVVLGGTRKEYLHGSKDFCIDSKKNLIFEDIKISEYRKYLISNSDRSSSYWGNCFVSGPVCKLYNKKILEGISFDESMTHGEDFFYNLDVSENISKIVITPEIWYHYRQNDHSATLGYHPNVIDQVTVLSQRLLETKYWKQEEYRPALLSRLTQQFHGLLTVGPLHAESGLNFRRQIAIVRQVLTSQPWKCIFSNENESLLQVGRFDSLLFHSAVHRRVASIIIMVQFRSLVRKVVRGS